MGVYPKLGLQGMSSGPCADPTCRAQVAIAAEGLGFESLWAVEHVVLARESASLTGPRASYPICDPIVALAHLATITKEISLGSAIINLLARNPVVLAKALASIDELSDGRLITGLGLGGIPEELAALGIDPKLRGKMGEEYLGALTALWTMEAPQYSGKYISFDGINAFPRPVRKPHPPILIAGDTDHAIRRAIRFGQGWIPDIFHIDHAPTLVSRFAEMRGTVDRDPALGDLELTALLVTPDGTWPPSRPISAEELQYLAELGFSRVLIILPREGSTKDLVSYLEVFADAAAATSSRLPSAKAIPQEATPR